MACSVIYFYIIMKHKKSIILFNYLFIHFCILLDWCHRSYSGVFSLKIPYFLFETMKVVIYCVTFFSPVSTVKGMRYDRLLVLQYTQWYNHRAYNTGSMYVNILIVLHWHFHEAIIKKRYQNNIQFITKYTKG